MACDWSLNESRGLLASVREFSSGIGRKRGRDATTEEGKKKATQQVQESNKSSHRSERLQKKHPERTPLFQWPKNQKTYNSRYSLVVTHPTTNLPI
jgi:hypothetical protein